MFWEPHIKTESLKSIGISIGIIIIFLLLRKLFSKYILAMFVRVSKTSARTYLKKLFLAFEKPIEWLFVIIGLRIAVHYFPFLSAQNELFNTILKAWVVIVIGWGLYNLTASSSVVFTNMNQKGKFKIDKILIPFISQGLRFFIIAITFSVVVSVFGYNISTFVAGLGLGGLAFALAAQDAIANLFGGIVILTEKPFTVDDWIETPSVEGTVEDITFRSTIVRTFADALVTIPNATLSNEPITNWSKRGIREAYFNVRVTYDTPLKTVKKVAPLVEEMLKHHPEILPETVYVAFHDLQDTGVDMLVYFYTKTAAYAKYIKTKEEVNFAILEILEAKGVTVAIPSRRVYTKEIPDEWKEKQ